MAFFSRPYWAIISKIWLCKKFSKSNAKMLIFDNLRHLSDFDLFSIFFYLFYPNISADPDGRERKVTVQVQYFILFLGVPLTLILHVYNEILKIKNIWNGKKMCNILNFFCFFYLFYLMFKQIRGNQTVRVGIFKYPTRIHPDAFLVQSWWNSWSNEVE